MEKAEDLDVPNEGIPDAQRTQRILPNADPHPRQRKNTNEKQIYLLLKQNNGQSNTSQNTKTQY
jgi:hypothetical protein